MNTCRDRAMDRSIVHFNVADFAAAVEVNLAPKLKGFPFVIAPLGTPRALVYDMSDTAFQEGVRKGMPLACARKINKRLAVIPPRFTRYQQVMARMGKAGLAYTPLLETGRTDGHIFLDVTGCSRLFGPPVDVAFRLKKTLQKELDLDPIWSLASSKTVAKVATRLVKPFGEYIVGPGEEADFLAPLPLSLIPGLSRRERDMLHGFNLFTVSQARSLSLAQLEVPFVHRAGQIHDLIRGIDLDPVVRSREVKSPNRLRNTHHFSGDTNNRKEMLQGLFRVVETTCAQLRRENMKGKKLRVCLFHTDGIQRQATAGLDPFTALDMTMFRAATRVLEQAWTRRTRVRSITLDCHKTGAVAIQEDLFHRGPDLTRQNRLARAMDQIRSKFGASALATGLTLTSPEKRVS